MQQMRKDDTLFYGHVAKISKVFELLDLLNKKELNMVKMVESFLYQIWYDESRHHMCTKVRRGSMIKQKNKTKSCSLLLLATLLILANENIAKRNDRESKEWA